MVKSLQSLAETHYENFPVGSFLLPKEFREPIRLVYAFARVADDIADEGNDSKETRLQRLDEWEGEFRRMLAGDTRISFFQELEETANKYAIPPSLFFDLIEAFRMETIVHSKTSCSIAAIRQIRSEEFCFIFSIVRTMKRASSRT